MAPFLRDLYQKVFTKNMFIIPRNWISAKSERLLFPIFIIFVDLTRNDPNVFLSTFNFYRTYENTSKELSFWKSSWSFLPNRLQSLSRWPGQRDQMMALNSSSLPVNFKKCQTMKSWGWEIWKPIMRWWLKLVSGQHNWWRKWMRVRITVEANQYLYKI